MASVNPNALPVGGFWNTNVVFPVNVPTKLFAFCKFRLNVPV